MHGRRQRPRDEPHERAVPSGPLPEHAEREGREQGRVDEREHQLQEVHDVVERRGDVGREDGQRHAEHRREPPHREIMPVGRAGAHVALIDVVRPHGIERRHVARHPGHERGQQRREAQAEQAGREEVDEQHRRGEVVVEHQVAVEIVQRQPSEPELRRDNALPQGEHPWENDEEGEQHLRDRRDQRRAPGRAHGVRRHGALHDQEIRAPVPEREHEAEAHHQAEPLDADGIVGRGAHERPAAGVGVGREAVGRGDGREPRHQPGPAAHVAQAQPHQRREAEHDQEELQHLVVDRAGEPAEEDVSEHDAGGDEDARVEAPAEQQVEQLTHGIERDAGRKDRHGRERDRVDRAGFLVEAQLQVLRDGAGARAVVERHHEQRHEHHRGDRADPVEVAGGDAVLGARGAHADHFLRAEIGGEEGQARHPCRHRATRQEEIGARAHGALQRHPDAEHEPEVQQHHDVVDPVQRRRRHADSSGGRP